MCGIISAFRMWWVARKAPKPAKIPRKEVSLSLPSRPPPPISLTFPSLSSHCKQSPCPRIRVFGYSQTTLITIPIHFSAPAGFFGQLSWLLCSQKRWPSARAAIYASTTTKPPGVRPLVASHAASWASGRWGSGTHIIADSFGGDLPDCHLYVLSLRFWILSDHFTGFCLISAWLLCAFCSRLGGVFCFYLLFLSLFLSTNILILIFIITHILVTHILIPHYSYPPLLLSTKYSYPLLFLANIILIPQYSYHHYSYSTLLLSNTILIPQYHYTPLFLPRNAAGPAFQRLDKMEWER